jgi:malate synthase
MEDTATAEISRAQIWQWLKHNKFSKMRFNEIFIEEVDKIRDEIGDLTFENSNYEGASNMFETLSSSNEFENFLTLSAYELIS